VNLQHNSTDLKCFGRFYVGALVFAPILSSHSAFAYNDPKHCQGYNACFSIGYNDGYSDAQKGVSPAYACIGHSQRWCSGYNQGFRAGNGGSNIYYGPNTGQTANLDVRGDNNKISIDQQTNNQIGDMAGLHLFIRKIVEPGCLSA